MKKGTLFLTIIICLLYAIEGTAQVQFGFNAGMNISSVLPLSSNVNTIVGDPADFIPNTGLQNLQYQTDRSTNHFFGGVITDITLSKVLRLRTGIAYSQKGWEYYTYNNNQLEVNIRDYHFKINYLQLPLDIEYGTPIGQGRAFVAVGPFIAYGLSGKIVQDLKGLPMSSFRSDTTYNTSVNFKTDVKKWDMGLNLVLGYETGLGIFLSAAYDLSLTHSTRSYFTGVAQHFSVFQLGLGYMLHKK